MCVCVYLRCSFAPYSFIFSIIKVLCLFLFLVSLRMELHKCPFFPVFRLAFFYCNSFDWNCVRSQVGTKWNREMARDNMKKRHCVRFGLIENKNVEHASKLVCGMHVINHGTQTKCENIRLLKCDSAHAHLNSTDICTWNCQYIAALCLCVCVSVRFGRSILGAQFHVLTERQFYLCVCFSFDLAIIYNWNEIYVHYRIDV